MDSEKQNVQLFAHQHRKAPWKVNPLVEEVEIPRSKHLSKRGGWERRRRDPQASRTILERAQQPHNNHSDGPTCDVVSEKSDSDRDPFTLWCNTQTATSCPWESCPRMVSQPPGQPQSWELFHPGSWHRRVTQFDVSHAARCSDAGV